MSQPAFITFSNLTLGWKRQTRWNTAVCADSTKKEKHVWSPYCVANATVRICCDIEWEILLVVKIHSFLLPCIKLLQTYILPSRSLSYTYYGNSRHMLLRFIPSLSLSLRSALRELQVFLKPQRCNYNSTFHYISFPDHILWRFGIEHVCTSGRTLSAWLAAAIVDASSAFGFAMTAILSVKSPREFAWFAR